MARSTPFPRRKKPGRRRYVADIQELETSGENLQNEHGQYVTSSNDNWTTVVTSWPCEILTMDGGLPNVEGGRVVDDNSSHVFYGEFWAVQNVTKGMRVVCEGVTYTIVAAFDPHGDKREMRIEGRKDA